MNRNSILYIILTSIVLLLIVRECQHKSDSDNLVKDITTYSTVPKVEKLKNGSLVYTNTSLKIQSEKQLRTLAESINDNVKQMLKNFKSVTNVTNITNEFYAGGDTVKNNIPCDFKPFKARHGSDSTYKLVMTISKNYNTVDSLSIKDSLSLVFGRRKQGFMKYDHAVDINHSNPLMRTTNIRSYQYDPQKKWYERTWVHMIAGAAIEIGVRKGVQQGINYFR